LFWKFRNGKKYLHGLIRGDGRAVKKYLGTGPAAEALVTIDEYTQMLDDKLQAIQQRDLSQWHELVRQSEDAANMARLNTRATLLMEEFRQHDRGEWRKKKGHGCPH
jgi:hypothetical protein